MSKDALSQNLQNTQVKQAELYRQGRIDKLEAEIERMRASIQSHEQWVEEWRNKRSVDVICSMNQDARLEEQNKKANKEKLRESEPTMTLCMRRTTLIRGFSVPARKKT